jgi:uncharacterized cofD-like protein
MHFQSLKIVCFGGGTGLPSLLSGLKKNPWLDITAVVNMFDSGGSSGELRDRFGILPPGDILKCLLALAEDERSARQLLLKRIEHIKSPGHTGGNALLYALEKVFGSYPDALDALGQMLSIRGSVIPVSVERGSLCATFTDGTVARNEVKVDKGIHAGKIVERLYLEPQHNPIIAVAASPDAINAIAKADMLCVGPGSLYTSVLSNFLPDGIRAALCASSAPIVFICNLLTEGEGMRGHTVSRAVNAIEYAAGRPISAVVCNTALPEEATLMRYAEEHKSPILPVPDDAWLGRRLVTAPLWIDPVIARHDADRIATLVFALTQTHCVARV